MRYARRRLLLALPLVVASLAFGHAGPTAAQRTTNLGRPSLSGTWMPIDEDFADKVFNIGLTEIPGGTKVTIDQQSELITISILPPEDKLRAIVKMTGRFYTTVTYSAAYVPAGGYGASGAPPVTRPTWVGEHFVVPDALPHGGRTMTYSLKGDQLQVVSENQNPPWEHPNTVTQLLKKMG